MKTQRAILVLGDAPVPETSLDRISGYGEVFVLARAVPDRSSRFVVDDALSHRRARQRLHEVATRLARGGAHVSGLVGDPDPHAARRDAIALFPHAHAVLEAA